MTDPRPALPAPATPSRLRANVLEYALLLVAFFAIGLAMYKTVEVGLAGDRTRDLTFAGTTAELERTLSSNGAARVGHLDRATIVVGHDSIVVDTIVVAADSATEPAVAAGGFLRDQVALYNDFAVRQAILASVDTSDAGTSTAEPPTLLRTALNDEGARVLSDRPSASGLVIRSPYAEDAWREVRTADWRSSPGLLGYDGDVLLSIEQSADRFNARFNGRDCSVSRETPHYYLYCQSALAEGVSRFYDFGFEVQPSAGGGTFGNAGPYRARSVWMNGRAQTFGQRHVAGGDVFELQALGPFVLSAAEWGTLASEQWINGRPTFANQRLGTLGFFASAGRSSSPAAAAGDGPVVLGFDATLAADLDRESRRFLRANGKLLSRLAVVILDVKTGEVKAIAEPARKSDDAPLLSFEPILVGSAVKPIMAAAILSRRPALADLRVSYAGDTVTSVAGVTLRKGFANEANGCGAQIGFDDFIRCSSNQYAAELLVRSLEEDGWKATGSSTLVPRAMLEHSSIASGLADVFDVDAYAGRTGGRLSLYWGDDTTAAAAHDRSLLPYESRPWLLFPDSAGTRVDWIARYAFGGWENRWTLLGLAQAYARIATGRDVQATFLHRAPATRAAFKDASASASQAFARVRTALREVPVSGTAAGLSQRLRDAVSDSVIVLAKTGTLNESTAGGKIKSLAIAVGRGASHASDAAITCGLVAVTYFEFADDRRAKSMHATLPRIHRDFAEGPLADVLGREWSRVSGCTETGRVAQASMPRKAGK
jgi:hypothetical protein